MGGHSGNDLVEGDESGQNKFVDAGINFALQARYELLDAVLVVQRVQDLPDQLQVELHGLDILWWRLEVLRWVRVEGVLLGAQEGRGLHLDLL